jgi:Ca2+-binding RTX toxin-like protein
MSGDPQADLIYAILALDSYNRGYGSGITGLNDDVGTKLGNFSINAHVNDELNPDLNPALEDGFYGIAYRNGDQVIVSYRGTDFNLDPLSTTPTYDGQKGGSDLVNGYGLALGVTDVPQATLAQEFEQAVASADYGQPVTITLTGHSLGGGLAGYIGALTGTNSVLFNYMPFGVAATVAGAKDNIGLATAWFTQGEFLQKARAGDLYTAVGEPLASIPVLPQNLQDGLQNLSGLLATETPKTDQPVNKTPLDSHFVDDGLGPPFTEYHSMAMLTSLLWARAQNKTDWFDAGQQLWHAFFDGAVADALPAAAQRTNKSNGGSAKNTLEAAIAYSALPVGEGERPFGDTGIWSMFDDARDLAKVLAGDELAFFSEKVLDGGLLGADTDVKQYLADLLVQYAGALAIYDVEQPMDSGGATDVRKGVLSLSQDDNVLSVDLSSVLWKDALNGHQVDPIKAQDFRDVFFKKAAGDALSQALRAVGATSPDDLARRFWGASDGHIIDRFDIVTGSQTGGTFEIAPRNYSTPPVRGDDAHVDVFVATTGNDTIVGTSGHDIIVGNGGTDVIDGRGGNDLVVANGGQKSVVAGGLGRDIVYNTSKGGELWGDIRNSSLRADGTRVGEVDGQQVEIKDDATNADMFFFAPDTTIMDAQHYDRLTFHGITLTGGDVAGTMLGFSVGMLAGFGTRNPLTGLMVANALSGAAGLTGAVTGALTGSAVYFDHLMPFIAYKRDGNDLLIGDMVTGFLSGLGSLFGVDDSSSGVMRIKNFDFAHSMWGFDQFALGNDLGDKGRPPGTMNMVFRDANPYLAIAQILAALPPIAGSTVLATVYNLMSIADGAMAVAAAVSRAAKGARWLDGNDPLVLDLNGDGIETLGLDDTKVHFDLDGDKFAQATGWLKGDDGFLVLDANGNGRIDDISEMFGGRFTGGFAELATLDSNHDGKISAADAAWSQLRVWRDVNSDGETDPGELVSLDSLGIVELGLQSTQLDTTDSRGATLLSRGQVTFADGATRGIFEATFQANDTDTVYRGESGRASWQQNLAITSKGFGTVTSLDVAMANDIEFGQLAVTTANAMTTPKLKTLVEQVGGVLGQWGMTQELTRELTPVLVGTDADGKAVLVDRAVYVEDASGGYWTLASGDAVKDPVTGEAIARATFEDVMRQVVASGQHWQVEQMWSPATRAHELQFRDETPYLMHVVDGRAVMDDWGVKNSDGTWRLFSGRPILATDGLPVSNPTIDDVLRMPHDEGQEWRVENIGFNPLADLPVNKIGVRFTDGQAVDYTVQVTDQDGSFYVWARNLDRALELEAKTGDSRGFNLRNYQIDFDHLDEVGSTDDSTYRVELLTPGEFNFALSLANIPFHPEMLTATLDNSTGHLAYSVNDSGQTSLSPDHYQSPVTPMIDLLGAAMQEYVLTSRRLAVRLALEGGLSDFAQGITYDETSNNYRPTTDRELAPMFEAIFAGAPATNDNDAALDYLTDWNEILWQIYPDFAPGGKGNLWGGTVAIDQAFIFQMMLPAFEADPIPGLTIEEAAHALSIDEKKIITHASSDAVVHGTGGSDFFLMSSGDQLYDGGSGSDYYFVGKNSGNDRIYDHDLGDNDELRFTQVDSSHVTARREGQDLILDFDGGSITVTDQFLGELNDHASNGKQFESGVNAIVFSDGVIWDRTRLAMMVAHPADTDDIIIGSGSGDVLWGGKGNDVLKGGAGGDYYIFERGDGQDVISEEGSFSFGPIKAGMDFLVFKGNITADDLYLIRDGNSSNLKIYVLDENGQLNRDASGNITNDGVEIEGQFAGVRLNLGAFSTLMGSSDGLDYVSPNLVERFIFDDGTSLDFAQIAERVLKNARTSGDDAIYGFLTGDTIDGGAGNDYLSGLEGGDTYVFGRGYGHDVIEDADFSAKLFGAADDILKFTDDLRWTDFDYLRDGASDTLTLQIKGTDDKVTLVDYLNELPFIGYTNMIEKIAFGDGTTWTSLQLLQHFIDVSETAGNDNVYGFDGIADTIQGGTGNDTLKGFGGNDTYIFALGDGHDVLEDSEGDDRLEFRGIASSDVTFTRTALDLIITVKSTGDSVKLQNQYVRDGGQHFAVESLVFSDRTIDFTQVHLEPAPVHQRPAGNLGSLSSP